MRKRDERFKAQDKYKALPDPIFNKSKTAEELRNPRWLNVLGPKILPSIGVDPLSWTPIL
jgi:hypothetical protein